MFESSNLSAGTRFLDPPRLLQRRRCVWLIQMKMTPEFDDAPDFIRHVEQVVNGVVRRHSPETFVLIKINNWFGSNWLGFSGKALGALGVWNKPRNEPADNIRIPPFVPSRVVSQRSFAAPTYEEVANGKPIHTQMPSNRALLRKAATAAPGSSCGTAGIQGRSDAARSWPIFL